VVIIKGKSEVKGRGGGREDVTEQNFKTSEEGGFRSLTEGEKGRENFLLGGIPPLLSGKGKNTLAAAEKKRRTGNGESTPLSLREREKNDHRASERERGGNAMTVGA